MAEYSFEHFQKEYPEIATKYLKLIEAQRSLKGLDKKTRQLINVGIQTANGSLRGVRYHSMMARKAGATKSEVLGAVVLNLHLRGVGVVLDTLPAAMAGFQDKS
jgi:AhpD family alkylhydroperoxidase